MASIEIIVGSMLGASEYVADALEQSLASAGHNCQIHLQPDFGALDQNSTWILCSSTHGAGDFPDNIAPFAAKLETAKLPNTQYLVVALGDSSYDTFCYAGKNLEKLMQAAGASPLADPLLIDVLEHPVPEDFAVEWLQNLLPNIALEPIRD